MRAVRKSKRSYVEPFVSRDPTVYQTNSVSLSRYFTIPKRNRGLRPILDLRELNRYIITTKFRMVTLKSVLPLLRKDDWFTVIDLTDTYFHIFIHPSHMLYLRFQLGTQTYQFKRLPFGLATAPRVFTKCMASVAAYLRLHKIHIFPYVNDWLLV